MRFSRPSTGTILGAIALFIALGGTAFAASATVVNIADPTNTEHIAHVNSAGQLETAGSVTNTVNTELAAPGTYLHEEKLFLESTNGCKEIATPPTGQAMIVRQLRINVFIDSSPGRDQFMSIYDNSNCSGFPVASFNPPTIGETTLPFDPGLGVPAKSGMSEEIFGSDIAADMFTDGYSVASSQVPTTGVTATGKARQHQQ